MLLREHRHRLDLRCQRLGQDPQRAIRQLHGAAPLRERLEQSGEIGRDAAEIDRRRQLKPVDPAGHVPGHAAGRTIPSARNLDRPARRGQLRHGGVEPGAGDLNVVSDVGGIGVAGPRRRAAIPWQHRDRVAFRGPVAPHEDPPCRVGRAASGRIGGDQDAGVVEPDSASELDTWRRTAPRRPDGTATAVFIGRHHLVLGIEADGGGIVEHELGSRGARFNLPAGPARQFQPRQIGHHRQSVDESIDLTA